MDKPRRLIVVGGVAAGPKAAAKARQCDPAMQITIIERGSYMSYGGCGMPYLIGGLIESENDLMATPLGTVRTPEFFKASKNIDVLIQHEATKIDRGNKRIEVKDLKTGKRFELGYDKLVLAVGSVPVIPQLPGRELGNVFMLTKLDEAIDIKRAVESGRIKHAVCVGGGLVTLEATSALGRRGITSTVIGKSDQVLFRFDYEFGALARKELIRNGVQAFSGETVKEMLGDDSGNVRAVVTDKHTIDADMVLLAKGVRPNVKLGRDAGLDIGETGAIKVDEHLRTSDPDIYAAGDCVETRNLVTGKVEYHPRGSTANKMGRVVGVNVTGGSETFPGVLGNVVLKVFDLNIGKVGLTEKEAKAAGYDVETAIAPAHDRAHFYPDAKQIITKLVVDKKTRRLLGMQCAGAGDAVKRIDVATAAITCGADMDTIANLDLGYAPPFSSAMDPLIVAANVVKNKLEGRAVGISPILVKQRLDQEEDFVFLDVRNDDEFAKIRIPGAILIPLPQLKGRLGELPKEREIISFCAVSLRAYAACLLLQAKGYQDVKFMDGGVAAWPYETE